MEGGGGNSCSVDGGRRGLVKGLSRETWKVGEIRDLIDASYHPERTYVPGT